MNLPETPLKGQMLYWETEDVPLNEFQQKYGDLLKGKPGAE